MGEPSAIRAQRATSELRRSTVVVRAEGGDAGKDGKGADPWKPPSDWDNAWSAYKKNAPSLAQQKEQAEKLRQRLAQTSSSSSSGSNSSGVKTNPSSNSSSNPLSGLFGQMEQYVSRDPRSEYPLSEEVDPLKLTEKRVLNVWTDTRFTYAGFGVLAGLFVYMVVLVGPPPS